MSALRVKQPGIHTTVQDRGRAGESPRATKEKLPT